MSEPQASGDRPPDEGGDPACWLGSVCEICGAFVEDEATHDCADRLPGADRPGPDPNRLL